MLYRISTNCRLRKGKSFESPKWIKNKDWNASWNFFTDTLDTVFSALMLDTRRKYLCSITENQICFLLLVRCLYCCISCNCHPGNVSIIVFTATLEDSVAHLQNIHFSNKFLAQNSSNLRCRMLFHVVRRSPARWSLRSLYFSLNSELILMQAFWSS